MCAYFGRSVCLPILPSFTLEGYLKTVNLICILFSRGGGLHELPYITLESHLHVNCLRAPTGLKTDAREPLTQTELRRVEF